MAWSLIAHGKSDSSGSVTLNTAASGGADLIVILSASYHPGGLLTPSDDQSNGSPTKIDEVTNGGYTKAVTWYWKNPNVAASHTISMGSNDGFSTFEVLAFKSSDPTAPLDVHSMVTGMA